MWMVTDSQYCITAKQEAQYVVLIKSYGTAS